MDYNSFIPFYERIPYLSNNFVSKVLFSFFWGGTVLVAHFLSINFMVFKNFGWVLSVIITVACLALFYATHTFRSLLPQLEARLSSMDQAVFKNAISQHLSDNKFVIFGLFSGTLNCIIGYLFGLPLIYACGYLITKVVVFLAYFFAGFVCGLAFLGIVGVIQCLSMLAKKMDDFFDYTSRDGCGGTLFLGEALVLFSCATLIVGVLISVYISKTAWTNKSNDLITLIYWGWMFLPFLMSFFVLFVPAISINSALNNYKLKNEVRFTKKLASILNKLEKDKLSSEEIATLYDEYEFQIKMRTQLHEMRTWPFGMSANFAYFLTVATSGSASVTSAIDWIKSIPHPH